MFGGAAAVKASSTGWSSLEDGLQEGDIFGLILLWVRVHVVVDRHRGPAEELVEEAGVFHRLLLQFNPQELRERRELGRRRGRYQVQDSLRTS